MGSRDASPSIPIGEQKGNHASFIPSHVAVFKQIGLFVLLPVAKVVVVSYCDGYEFRPLNNLKRFFQSA